MDSVPNLGIFACCGHSQKNKREHKQKKKRERETCLDYFNHLRDNELSKVKIIASGFIAYIKIKYMIIIHKRWEGRLVSILLPVSFTVCEVA